MSDLTTNIDSKAHDKIREDLTMPAMVEFPTVVKEALKEFGLAFARETNDVEMSSAGQGGDAESGRDGKRPQLAQT